MGLFHRGGRALAPMAQDAAKFGEFMRDRRVRPEGLGLDVHQARLLQSHVTGGAAIHHTQFRQPDLLHTALEPPGQRGGFAASPDQSQVLLLIAAPLAGNNPWRERW